MLLLPGGQPTGGKAHSRQQGPGEQALEGCCPAACLQRFAGLSLAFIWSNRANASRQGGGATQLSAVAASAETPVFARTASVASLTASGIERRHRSVAASPTRFFELLVSFKNDRA